MFWLFGHQACGFLVPRPGIEPAPPALGSKVLTTGLPGMSLMPHFSLQSMDSHSWPPRPHPTLPPPPPLPPEKCPGLVGESCAAVPQPPPGQKKWNKLWFLILLQFHWIPRWFWFQLDCWSSEAPLTPSPGQRSLQWLTLSSSPVNRCFQRPATSSRPCLHCRDAPGSLDLRLSCLHTMHRADPGDRVGCPVGGITCQLSILAGPPHLWHLCSFVVVQSLNCIRLSNPVDCSKPGCPALQHDLELAEIHVHQVGDASQPFHPLSPPSPPALDLSQHQGLFQ